MSATNDNPDHTPEQDKSVGYRRPPGDSRFKKGISGNPRGRPKGRLNLATILLRTLREKVVINEDGQRKAVSKFEAAIKQLVNKAASGQLAALRQLVDLARDAEAKQNVAETQNSAINDLDQQVMEGILKRFQLCEDQNGEPEEADSGNDQPN